MEFLKIEGLIENRRCAQLFGAAMGLWIAKSRDENQGNGRQPRPDPVEHVEPTRARHPQITYHQVGLAVCVSRSFEAIEELLAVATFIDPKAPAAQGHAQHPAHRGVVIGQEYHNRRCHRVWSV
jgi:hypothetical protein